MSDSSAVLTTPPLVREGNESLILLTEAAGLKVRSLIEREKQGEYLRVAISGGGCNGLSYKLRFTPEPKKGDILVRTAGVKVLVDSKAVMHLLGTRMDFVSDRIKEEFVFENPNSKGACGCGESFTV